MDTAMLMPLQNLSNRYGADPAYVLAGGGNTSYKTADTLYVKGSGTSLATIKAEDFVRMDRSRLSAMWEKTYSEDEKTRESEVLADMMAARMEGETRRPSVETLLHDLFPQKYVLHVHPAIINGLTCGKNGKEMSRELFPKSVWVEACKPGYILAALCREKLNLYKEITGTDADLLFLENHGVFFAANTVADIDALAASVMKTLYEIRSWGFAARIDALGKVLTGISGAACSEYLEDEGIATFDPDLNSPTPDHIVYCKANYMTVELNDDNKTVEKTFDDFVAANGYQPRVVLVKRHGAFILAENEKQLATTKAVFLDNVGVFRNAEFFGGYSGMRSDLVDFIVNWEVESYRAKVNS